MEHNPPVTVLMALTANICPLCGARHGYAGGGKFTSVIKHHADVLTSQGYLGYSYTNEKWLWSE